MKYITLFICLTMLCFSCAKLDLNPLAEGASDNWNENETQINISLNDLYRIYLWENETNFGLERMTDNWNQRDQINAFAAGSITGQWSIAENTWINSYKGIARANTILEKTEAIDGGIPAATINRFRGEARFMRAALYANLIFHYGDVPFYKTYITIEEAFAMGRTDKSVILKEIYEDFDYAIATLPATYNAGELKRATKGAAMAFKARAALLMGDFTTARDAAKACMDLKVYTLHPDFGEYFLPTTKNSNETIFALPRSVELGVSWTTTNFITRNAGGASVAQPSWELMCAFSCDDGLPIDESPRYNPRNPFLNRDPRCKATIVEFGTEHVGFIYDPNPYATTVLNVATGAMIPNKDSRAVDQYASYNGLTLKKWVDNSWTGNLKTDYDVILMRYADVLLMYAEAKIELNEIDDSVLAAINQVRARAYKKNVTDVTKYPALSNTHVGQSYLRKQIRNERRVELAWENRRFYDIIRWRIAEKVLVKPHYGILDQNDLKSKVVDKGLWFFPGIPEIDEDWLPDFTAMYNAGLIKVLVQRAFDKERQYLWPIPTKEILINENLKPQNPGY
ncbi:RagB/SusD family nutrient uptake outer membrane protein [Sphingobacterium faecale]|uniref:RagB/SusD family nutrient uptake outer membrane protein n=1 Tax=Sphingobacterium faecale TaxID=2803775 RepID=A0ABS1R632_9SPHI|nr:RagB/SusD family nutrient uptake outer membrane protein [Sphingobacterium faecale]MBL1409331.1 RagB/SusD family nutrient uptake outer membrane protein [Sphingobacterium faecale]